MDDNPEMDEDRAWAICKSQEKEGNLKENAKLAEGCPDGQVNINGECVAVESVDVPPALLSAPRVMASASPLDTQPIKREELGDGEVAYRGLRLIAQGVWTDSESKTPTLYDERTFENTTPEYDSSKYNGPPVNVAHDIHKSGREQGEPHEASVGGYVDPKSIDTDGEALFGDVILNTDDPAGAFLDENLKSALENDGTAGFSPSVELMPTELEDAEHARAEEYVKAAEFTGLGMVRDPASKSVDLAHETQNRAVAMAAGGKDAKALYLERVDMADAETYRDVLESNGIDTGEMTDEEVMDLAEELGESMQMGDYEDDEEEEERENADDEEEEEDEEEEMDMAEGDDKVEKIEEQVMTIMDRLEDLEDSMAGEEDVEEMSAELEEAKEELAAAETVEELKETFDKRLSKIEEEGKNPRTMSDDSTDEDDWEPKYGGTPPSTSSW